MSPQPLADGWSTVPADGLYVVYIPRSFTICEIRALEARERLRKGWRVWGPFPSIEDCAEPLEALRLHFRAETEQRRGKPALEPAPQSEAPLDSVVAPLLPESTTLESSALEALLRKVVREELERILAL